MRDSAAENSCWMISSFGSVINKVFTLATLKNKKNDCTHLLQKEERRRSKRLSSHRATVTDGVSKLGYTSVIFVDLGVKVDGSYYFDLLQTLIFHKVV